MWSSEQNLTSHASALLWCDWLCLKMPCSLRSTVRLMGFVSFDQILGVVALFSSGNWDKVLLMWIQEQAVGKFRTSWSQTFFGSWRKTWQWHGVFHRYWETNTVLISRSWIHLLEKHPSQQNFLSFLWNQALKCAFYLSVLFCSNVVHVQMQFS